MTSYGREIMSFKTGAYAPVLTLRIGVFISVQLGPMVTMLIILVAATEIRIFIENVSGDDRNSFNDVLVECGYI